MKKERLAHRLALTLDDFTAIRQAVQDAEMRTSGEIALAAVGESATYAFRELVFSVFAGALVFALCLPFHDQIQFALSRFFWVVPAWYATAVSGIFSFTAIGVCFLFADTPYIDRLVVSRKEREQSVYRRALRHFVESGVYATANRTGILIFLSLTERQVYVLADTGIAAKIESTTWNAIAQKITEGIKGGSTGSSLTEAIAECGSLLAEHFPVIDGNPNELPDGLVLLEDRA